MLAAPRFHHLHLNSVDPDAAIDFYTAQFAATSRTTWAFPALEPDGMFRTPSGGVAFGDVWLPWYMRQGDQPLVGSRGNLYDHFALGVTNLDGWVAKLRNERVNFLEEPYNLGDTRAVMIAGPSHEAIELVEVPD